MIAATRRFILAALTSFGIILAICVAIWLVGSWAWLLAIVPFVIFGIVGIRENHGDYDTHKYDDLFR